MYMPVFYCKAQVQMYQSHASGHVIAHFFALIFLSFDPFLFISHLLESTSNIMASDNSTYLNPTAHSYISPPNPRSSSPSAIQVFHASLPSFCPTPLIELFQDSSKLPRPKLFVKAETCRLGLPSFKILGGSWATYQSLLHACSLPSAATFQEVCQAAQERQIVLYAATDGNHGRAIARMAKIIGLKARIYVPDITVQSTRDLVASEGSEVIVVNNSEYDEAIKEAADAAKMEPESKGVLVQDHVAYEGYDDVPRVSQSEVLLSLFIF
jgi:diaminopropionate ammonia-lyase